MIRCLGIDPGSVIGLCLLEIEGSLSWTSARYLDHSAIHRSDAKSLKEWEKDVIVARKVLDYLLSRKPDIVAIEQAAEAKGVLYRGYAKQKTETSFRSGVYYGLVIAQVGRYNAAAGRVAVYPSVDSKTRGKGWQGHSNRRATIARIQEVGKIIHAPDDLLELKETVAKAKGGKPGKVSVDFRRHNEADALGIIAYHIDRMREQRAENRQRLTGGYRQVEVLA